MSYKHIVALAVGEPFDRQTLASAAWLALEHEARVTVVPAYPDAAASVAAFGVSAGGAYPQEVFAALSEAMETTQAQIEQVCREVCEQNDLTFGPGEGERPRRLDGHPAPRSDRGRHGARRAEGQSAGTN